MVTESVEAARLRWMLILLERPEASSLGFGCQHQNFLIGYHAGQLGECASDLNNRTVGPTHLLTRMLP